MASFSIRTLDFKRNGKDYKIHLRAEDKSMQDTFDRLCERLETSGVDSMHLGPLTIIARRAR